VCFSAEADFAIAAALTPVAVATLRRVRHPKELLVGALPLVFAAHQLTEGFVWLGLSGDVSAAVRDAAILGYLLVAQVLLPVLVPAGMLLLERDRIRRWWMLALLGVGAVVAWRFLSILTTHPVGAQALDRIVHYDTDWHFGPVLGAGYVLATCGPALLSTTGLLRWFGVANVIGLAAANAIQYTAVTSVWCAYAALVSCLLLVDFQRRRAAEARLAPRRDAVH
jgi:hypothetical protein